MADTGFWIVFRAAVAEHRAPTPELLQCLETLPSSAAEQVCTHLLGVASRWVDDDDDGDAPSPQAADAATAAESVDWDVGDFVRGFVHQSRFVDRLVDAVQLSPAGRRLKWSGEARARTDARARQLAHRDAQSRRSYQHVRCERRNAVVYHKLCKKGCDVDTEVDALLVMPFEILRMQPPTFWSGLRIEAAPDERRRALLHKTRLFTERFGATAIPAHARQRLQESFEALSCTERVLRPRKQPLAYLRDAMLVVVRGKRRPRRRALTAPSVRNAPSSSSPPLAE